MIVQSFLGLLFAFKKIMCICASLFICTATEQGKPPRKSRNKNLKRVEVPQTEKGCKFLREN